MVSENFRPTFLLICAGLFVATVQAGSNSQLDSRGVPSDVPYIQCETCFHVVEAVVNETNKIGEKELTEIKLFDVVESLCDPNSPVGKWATKIDLQERLRKIHLVKQDGVQECKQECRTLALACAQVLDSVETELAEHLYMLRKNGEVTKSDVESWLCDKNGMSSACSNRVPLFPKSRPTGPPFVPRDEKQAAIDEMIKKMQAENGGLGMGAMNPNSMGDQDLEDDDDSSDEKDADSEAPAFEDDQDLVNSDNGDTEPIDADTDPMAGSSKDDGTLYETAKDEI